MKNRSITFFVSVIVILTNCILCADYIDSGGFTYTLEMYPPKITLHELIYVRLTLENKTNKTLEGRKSGQRDFDCFIGFVGDNQMDTYLYPFNRSWNIVIPPPIKILPNERFVPVNLFIEFPEILTLKSYRSESEPEKNANFIKKYVDSGKKCKLSIHLYDTGQYLSDDLEINSRPAKEMAAIKKWHSQFSNFLADTHRISETNGDNRMTGKKWERMPSVKDYQDFESQLSDGTLKNFVKFRRLLAAIPEEKSHPSQLPTLDITKPYRDLGDYLDTLHSFERDHLIIEAMEYFRGSIKNVGDGSNPNYLKMKYLLIPKLPKSEREEYLRDVHNKEYKNILLKSPEPDKNTDQNLPSPLSITKSPMSVSTTSVSPTPPTPPTSEQQIDLTEPSKTQLENNSSWRFVAVVIVVILFVIVIAGIIFVRKISHK
jgi:hypothetical protein